MESIQFWRSFRILPEHNRLKNTKESILEVATLLKRFIILVESSLLWLFFLCSYWEYGESEFEEKELPDLEVFGEVHGLDAYAARRHSVIQVERQQ